MPMVQVREKWGKWKKINDNNQIKAVDISFI